MEPFSALLALCAGNSPVPVNSPHKGQWRGALMFSLICAWINYWVNNREAADLRRRRGHYDVNVMLVIYTGNMFVSVGIHLNRFNERNVNISQIRFIYPCVVIFNHRMYRKYNNIFPAKYQWFDKGYISSDSAGFCLGPGFHTQCCSLIRWSQMSMERWRYLNTYITTVKYLTQFIVRRAGLLWSQQDFEWWWSVPLSSASLY